MPPSVSLPARVYGIKRNEMIKMIGAKMSSVLEVQEGENTLEVQEGENTLEVCAGGREYTKCNTRRPS